MVQVENIGLTAEYMNGMKTKRAQILNEAIYREFTDDEGGSKKKLCMNIELETHEIMEYIPNKTSVKSLSKLFGSDTLKWKDKLIQFYVSPVMFQGKKTLALYIDDKDLNKVEEIKI